MNQKLKNAGLAIKRQRVPIIVVGLLVGVGLVSFVLFGKKSTANDLYTGTVERGTVELDVTATGTVQAVTTVQVGSQVSGTVSWLGADFKSKVKSGQVVAKLDPSIFQAALDNANAALANSQAAVVAAQTDINNQQANIAAAKANEDAARVQALDNWDIVKRDKELVNVIATRDLQAAEAVARASDARTAQASAQIKQAQAVLGSSQAKLQQANAAVKQAKAEVDLARLNVNHCIITSPIDGVVVSRSVDVGQTVAASLQAPTLFTIANDLTHMQVLGGIDEADVGQISEGIDANFTVDAFPNLVFTGKISQIRLNAQTLQNVVTYTTVIDFSNPDEKLLPGMTANITVPVSKHDNVLTVPNAALRYKPALAAADQKELDAKIAALRKEFQAQHPGNGGGAVPQSSGTPGQPGSTSQQRGTSQPAAAAPGQDSGPGAGHQRSGSGSAPGSAPGSGAHGAAPVSTRPVNTSHQGQIIYILGADKKVQPIYVRVGITNGRVSEVSAPNLKQGDLVVLGQNDAGQTQTSTSPLGGRRPGR